MNHMHRVGQNEKNFLNLKKLRLSASKSLASSVFFHVNYRELNVNFCIRNSEGLAAPRNQTNKLQISHMMVLERVGHKQKKLRMIVACQRTQFANTVLHLQVRGKNP